MPFIKIQNDFTHGELDPRGITRFDVSLYHKALKRARNVLIDPLGGARRRFGTKYVGTITASENQYLLREFDYADDTKYVLVFTNNNIAVYYDDAKVHDITTTYTGAEVSNLGITQSFNLMVITHPDHAPAQLVRGGSHTSWTLSNISFKNEPGYDYAKNYDGYTFSLSAVTVGTGKTLTSTTAVFTDDYIGGYFIAPGPDDYDDQIGFARITAVGSATPVTTCTVDIVSAFNSAYTTAVLSGKNALLTEKAWSATRGYPVSCSFYEGRLFFGGSKSLPETLFASVSNDYTNFDIGVGNDSDALQADLKTTGRTTIKYLMSDKVLQIFTASSEFATPQLSEQPLTPSTLGSIRRQSRKGISNVPPQIIDNTTIFVSQGGKEVDSFQFTQDSGSYLSIPVSLIASHLIKSPVDSAVRESSSQDPINYYFIINGEDGSLASLQLLSSQDILAWTLSTTDGSFKRISRVGEHIYFLIKRTINGSDVTYLEKADFTLYMDSCITQTYGTPTTTISNLTHLIGETVNVIGDGFVLDDAVVNSSGVITIERACSIVTVGLPFVIPGETGKHTLIETLPFNLETQKGQIAFTPKRINRIFVDYYLSLGILVQDTLIPSLEFDESFDGSGDYPLDSPETGIFEDSFINGWDANQTITISQEKPLPMTILGIGVDLTG